MKTFDRILLKWLTSPKFALGITLSVLVGILGMYIVSHCLTENVASPVIVFLIVFEFVNLGIYLRAIWLSKKEAIGPAVAAILPTAIGPFLAQGYIYLQIRELYDKLDETVADGFDGWFPLTAAFFFTSVIGLFVSIFQEWGKSGARLLFIFFGIILLAAVIFGKSFFLFDIIPSLNIIKPLPKITLFFLMRVGLVVIAIIGTALPKR